MAFLKKKVIWKFLTKWNEQARTQNKSQYMVQSRNIKNVPRVSTTIVLFSTRTCT